MKLHNEGSMLLTFFLVLSSLTLACSIVWLAATLFFDAAIQKQNYESSYQQTAGMLKYGISLCTHNFDNVRTYLKNNKVLTLSGPFDTMSKKNYRATMRMTLRDEQCVLLNARVHDHEKTIFESSCELIKSVESTSNDKVSEYFAINAWKKNSS